MLNVAEKVRLRSACGRKEGFAKARMVKARVCEAIKTELVTQGLDLFAREARSMRYDHNQSPRQIEMTGDIILGRGITSGGSEQMQAGFEIAHDVLLLMLSSSGTRFAALEFHNTHAESTHCVERDTLMKLLSIQLHSKTQVNHLRRPLRSLS